MCDNNKFYICEHCGNLIGMISDAGVPMMCCGQKMTKLEPGVIEASEEKHLPVVSVEGNKVTVSIGSVAHPMTEEHSILWVYLETTEGGQRKCLKPDSEPTVTFALADEKPLSVYAYCNLHGLWKTEIEEPLVCDLLPLNTKSKEDYIICKCNNVSFFDIIDEIHKHSDTKALLEMFENVKNTTHCSTGCGGCYEKVLAVISEAMSGNL
ncbi:MAG: (2Fe-2S)-binding protein [Clostridia bacterium]|nr:(2Fe-2S)-binding protein [Clostridia bacterium]MBR2389139.1 (2Fe-2S)-binding protein [Clostridia bacterium]